MICAFLFWMVYCGIHCGIYKLVYGICCGYYPTLSCRRVSPNYLKIGHPIFEWVAEIWLKDRAPGWKSQQLLPGPTCPIVWCLELCISDNLTTEWDSYHCNRFSVNCNVLWAHDTGRNLNSFQNPHTVHCTALTAGNLPTGAGKFPAISAAQGDCGSV